MSNTLSMTLAEWLMRMSVAKVAPVARVLAVYATVLDVTGNDELANVTGISGRTFDKHKADLKRDGWVIITRRTGGRGRGIAVSPAVSETPVKFTDVSQGNPRNICALLAQQTPAVFAEVSKTETPAELAPVSMETPAEFAEVSPSRALVHARIETPSGLLTPQKLQDNPPLSPMPTFGYGERATIENGVITLHNGLRQYWLDKFGGDAERLDLALMQAAGYVQDNSRRPLEAQISSQLARAAAEKRDRDQRYAKAAQRSTGRTAEPGESRIAETDRMAREARQRMNISWEGQR